MRIQQVALNIIRNGMEAMVDVDNRQRGVLVTTALKSQSKNQQVIIFNVIDYGVGIADGAEKYLFDPFHTTKKNGMGIGLSICQSIIQDHGGDIGFRSNSEGGTTFYFSIPV
ncbi:MAG: ATP-binding protein [Pseudomonadales bacterium]